MKYRTIGSMGTGEIQTSAGFRVDVRNALTSSGVSPEKATQLSHHPAVADSFARGDSPQVAAKRMAKIGLQYNARSMLHAIYRAASKHKSENFRKEAALVELTHVEYQINQMKKRGANEYGGRRSFDAQLKELKKQYRELYKIAFG